jgi:hypothetical protein
MVSAPKKTIVWYVSRSLLIDPNLINKDEKGVLSQYFIENALKKKNNKKEVGKQ